ncbi:hypothetical protein KM043_005573 [Ampulex compressa]|nr:hypothetical protein KM043_005573 [Ampulex compressa]
MGVHSLRSSRHEAADVVATEEDTDPSCASSPPPASPTRTRLFLKGRVDPIGRSVKLTRASESTRISAWIEYILIDRSRMSVERDKEISLAS